jgi:tetratricopeptide (TPR) repeat protein
MEQADVSATSSAPIASIRLALSDEAKASLQAVRVAQEAARLQARRQTRVARLWFAASLGALALAGFALGPRASHWWRARHHRSIAARPSLVLPAPAHPPAMPGPLAPANAPTVPATPAASSVAQGAPAPAAGADEGCDTSAIRSAPWRLSPDACARAFALHPDDAALALAVAHAEHARSHLAEAAQWAKRALALDPQAAEAYVIIARADTAGGRGEDARAAYREYLRLAPRGWHHAEARSALRPSHMTARLDPSR